VPESKDEGSEAGVVEEEVEEEEEEEESDDEFCDVTR
jgi:hypothetical protein